MKILLLGANGQVGWELQRSLLPLGQLKACDRKTADLNNVDALAMIVQEFSPDFIVNAAAYTAVDQAETDKDNAHRINATAVECLAKLAKEQDAWLIHYSTDYVFDGTKESPYIETDTTNPLNVYGQSKRKGEEAIVNSGCKYLIFRTSWVYATRQDNFAKTMIRLAKERESLNVIADQFGVPTSAELIADITSTCINRLLQDAALAKTASGIYHLAPTGETTWHGYAYCVLKEAEQQGASFKTTAENVGAITTAQYPLPAKRPANSRLNVQKICDAFDVELPNWQTHVHQLICELSAKDSL